MADDALTPGAAGQGGNEGAPADGGQGPDFERSYNELRPQYTRATQELGTTRERLSEYEQLFESLHDPDPEVQRAAMDALGLEPADTGSTGSGREEEFVDPLEKEVQELRTWREQEEQRRELEERSREDERLAALRDDYIGDAISLIEKEAQVKFNKREEEALGNLAIAMPDDQGVPDVTAAYDLLYGSEGVLETNRQRWIETKTGAAQAPLGRSIPVDQRPKSAGDRIAYIDKRMQALDQQQ